MILVDFAGKIKGDSLIEGHDGWITVDSFDMGVGRAIHSSGGGKDREVSNPSFSEISMSKSTDISSADIWFQAVQGQALGDCTIHFVQTGTGDSATTQVYLTIVLTDAIISSYSQSGGANSRPSESFAVNFTKIEFKYDQFDGKTKTDGTPKKWDVMANKSF